MYRTSLQKESRVPNRRTVRRYEKVFLNIRVKIFVGHMRQNLQIPRLAGWWDTTRLADILYSTATELRMRRLLAEHLSRDQEHQSVCSNIFSSLL